MHDPGYADQARAAAQRMDVSGRVHFVGPLDHDDKWAAYDDATAYVLPSYHENFGATVVEAMSRGTPVVASREVQACQYVEQSGGGQIVRLDVESLAAGLRSLLALSPAERANGRARSTVRPLRIELGLCRQKAIHSVCRGG